MLGASPARALDLIELHALAVRNDPAFQAALKDRDAGVAQKDIERAGLLPSINYRYSTGQNRSRVTQSTFLGDITEHRNYRSYSSSVELQQPLLDYEAISAYRQGEALALFSNETYRGKSQELVVRVFEAYTQALYAKDQLLLAQAQKRSFSERMQLNQRLLDLGEGTRTDILETSARYNMAQAQEIEAQDNEDAANRELSALSGLPLNALTLAPLHGPFTIKPLLPDEYEAWQALALRHNATLQSLAHSIDAAAANVEKSRAGHLPKVGLYARAGKDSSNSESSYNQTYSTNSVGLQVSIPLYAGGRVSAQTGQAVDSMEKLRYERDARRDALLNDLRKQYNLYKSSVAKIRAYELAVASANQLIVATRKSVAGGERVNVDVLNAEQQLYDALRNMAQARYGYLGAWVKLKYYAGTLDPVGLEQVASYLALGLACRARPDSANFRKGLHKPKIYV
ncbi:TolC family outer membrane protein [Achromobacter xylosoxidans]